MTATVYLYSQREHPTSLQDLKFLSQFGFHFLFKGDDSLSSRIDQLLYALEQNQALPSINFDSQTLSYLLQKVATNSPGSTSNSNQKQRQDEWQNLQTILSLSQKSSSDPWLYNISTSLVVMEKLEQHYRDLETNGSTKTRMALVETVAQVVAPNTSQSDGKCSTRVDPELITASCFSQLSNQLELTEDHHEPILRHFLSLWMLTKQLVVLQQHSPDQDFLQHMLHRTFLSTDFNYQIQALHEHYFTNGNMQISISELVYHTLQVYNPKERERTKWIPLIQEWLSSPDIQVNHQAVRCLVALSSEVLDPKIWSNLLLSFAKKLEINSKPPTQELESILYFLSLQQERNARLNHQQLFQAPEEEQGVEPRGKPLFQCLIPKPRPRPSSPKIYFMDLTFEGVREDLEEEEVNDMSDHEKQMELDARVLDDIQKEWLKVLFQWSVLPLEDKQHTKVIQMLSQMAVQSHLPFETSQELDREDNMEGLCWFFQRWLVEIFTHLDQTLTRTMSKEKAADQREIHQVVSHILKTITSYEKSILYSNRDHPCSDVIMAELEKALTAVALLFGTNDGQIQKDMNDHHPHLMKSLIECLVLCLHCFSPETEPPLSNNGDVAIEANEWAAEKKKYLRIFNQAIRVLANISAMSCQQFQKCHDRSNMFDIQRMMMSSEYGQRAFNSLCRTSSSTSHHRNCDTIELESNVLRLVLNMKTLHSLVDLSPEEETKAASYYCEGTNVIYPSADLLQALDHDKDSSQLDVVFLHGLRGHAFGTWRVSPDSLLTTLEGEKEERDFCCWPQAWLGPDLCQNLGPPENKNMCRILTLGYDASLLSSSSDPWRPLTFEEYAASIAKQLSAAKVGQDRPVVFITHSLGGLMLKGKWAFVLRLYDSFFNTHTHTHML